VTSRQTASTDPRMNTLNTARSDSAIAFPPGFGRGLRLAFGLDAILELGDRAGPEGAELGGPTVVNDLDRHHVEIEPALPAYLLRDDQVGARQHLQVLQDRHAARLEVRTEVLNAA